MHHIRYIAPVLFFLFAAAGSLHAQWKPIDPDDVIESEPNEAPGRVVKLAGLSPFQQKGYVLASLELPLNRSNSIQVGLGYTFKYTSGSYGINHRKPNGILEVSYRHYFPRSPMFGLYWGPGLNYSRMYYQLGRRFCRLNPLGGETCGVDFTDATQYRDDRISGSWRVGLQPRLSKRILLDIWGGLATHYILTTNTYKSIAAGFPEGDTDPMKSDLQFTGLFGFNIGYNF